MKNGELSRVAGMLRRLTDEKFPDIGGHQQDVAMLCDRYAEFVGMTEEDRETFDLAGCMHDVGKLIMPDGVVHKPARLTAVEMSMMQSHCQKGAYILEPLGMDPRIVEVVRQHHEDYDGGGYPLGLRGEEIALWPRAIRALDSHAALTENRVYHQGLTDSAALQLMRSQSERYDPEILRTVFSMFNEPWEIE
jgi:putative nucleotidyltransferase with HDIG domain